MKSLSFFLAAVLSFTISAGERYLIENGGGFGEIEFEKPYFSGQVDKFRVVDKAGKCVPQKSLDDYARFKRIRFFSSEPGALYLEAGSSNGKKLDAGAGELWNFDKLKWKSSIPQLARTKDGFAFVSATHIGRPYLESNQVDLPPERDADVIFEYAGVSKSMHPWTLRIQILQFDKDGKALPCCVVDERWLNFFTSPGTLQHIRQAGKLDRRAAKVAVRVHLHQLYSKDVNEMGYKAEKSSVRYPVLEVRKFSLRSGRKYHPGGANRKLFTGNGVRLDGRSGVAFNPAGAEMWSEGKVITDKREFAFPLEEGSVEIDFTPENNPKKYTIFDTDISADTRKRSSALEVVANPKNNTLSVTFPGMKKFTFPAVIPAGKRCRLTLDWNKSEAGCFLNGRELAKIKLNGAKLFTLDVPDNRYIPELVAVGMSARAIFVNANRPDDVGQFMKGTLHSARFSDIRRGNYTGALVSDDRTLAYFDYSKSIDGTNTSGRGFVSGVWYGREPLLTPIPYVAAQKQLPFPQHDIYNDPPSKDDFVLSKVMCEKRFTMTPGKKYLIDCEQTPRMEYIEIACPDDEKEIVDPLVRKPDDIDPRSYGAIKRDMKLDDLSEAEKASKIFGYLLKVTDYFIQHPISYPQPYRGDMSDYNPLAMINNYIGEDCGPQNFATMNLFNSLAGFPVTLTAGNGHAFQQLFFDGSWQVWDLSAEQFMRSRDPRRAASLEELERDPWLFRHSDYFSHAGGFIRIKKRKNGFFPPVERKIVGYTLRNGEKFRIPWYNNMICNNIQCAPHITVKEGMIERGKELKINWPAYEVKWRIPPEYSSGVFICDKTPAEKPHLFKCAGNHFIYSFSSAHPMTNVSVKTEPSASVQYSFDGGKTYLADPTLFIKGRRQIMVKVNAAPESIKKFSTEIAVQLNTRSLTGKLSQGRNELSLDLHRGNKADVKVVWSVEDKPLTVEGALSCGAAKGWEKHLIFLDSNGRFSGKLSGATQAVKVVSSSGVTSKIEDGKLVITAAKGVNNSLETVKIIDGRREKVFRVAVSRNSRLHTAENARARRGAKIENGLIKFTAPGQQAVFRQDKLPRGKYTVFVLFNMHFPKEMNDMRMLALSGVAEDYEVIGRVRNLGSEFFIVKYSKPHFKWDFPQQGRYPYSRVKVYETRPNKKLILKSCPLVKKENGVICEVAAVLLADASNDDFIIELAKYLTTLNSFPERF